MKLHRILLLFGASALLLTACGDGSTEESNAEEASAEEVSSEKLIEEAKDAEPLPKGIVFNTGVEDGFTNGDSNNYIDIDGTADDAEKVIVIYEGIVVDVLDTDNDGYFSYYNKGNSEPTELIFGTNANAQIGDRLEPHEVENRTDLVFIPHPQEEEPSNDNFSIGETAIFSSGIEITVTHVGLSDEKPNGEIDGNFVRVDFTVDNQTSEDFSINGHHIELYDGERYKAESNAKDWYSETIAPGMKGNASVYYDAVAEGPFTVIIGAGIWESE